MTRSEIDAALAAANPLTSRTAAALPLGDAETELVERIAAIPVRPGPARSHPISRRRRFPLVLVAAAAVAVGLALLPSGDRSGGPTPAFAAALVRFANASPLALLQLSDWHVVYADEEPGGFGEMHFVRGAADADGTPRGASYSNEASLAGRVASLTWYPVMPGARKYLDGGHETAATGLGVTARRFVGEGRGRGWVDVSAFLIFRGRELTFRATVTDMAMFYAELRALNAVDATTWLRAMPPSVVKTADSTTTAATTAMAFGCCWSIDPPLWVAAAKDCCFRRGAIARRRRSARSGVARPLVRPRAHRWVCVAVPKPGHSGAYGCKGSAPECGPSPRDAAMSSAWRDSLNRQASRGGRRRSTTCADANATNAKGGTDARLQDWDP